MDVRALVAAWPVDAPRGAVARFCREHAISRSWFHELRARSLADPQLGVLAQSRRPLRSPSATSMLAEDLIVRARKELEGDGWDAGPLSVQDWMRRRGVDPPSRATVARILVRRGLVTPQPQKRPRQSWRRFQFELAHECWQLDATEWRLADGAKVAIFQLIDDRSRFALASLAADAETTDAAIAVVSEAIRRHRPPLRLLSDNGAALNSSRRGRRTALQTMLHDLGVTTISSSPYHPQTCGKNERIHATLKRWLRARPAAATMPDLQTLIDAFDDHYNHRRGHQALAGHTPADVLRAAAHALTPTPPNPTTAPPTASPRRLVEAKTAPNGNVGIGGKLIQIGAEHSRRTVIGNVDGNTIRVYTTHGTLIREITTTPSQRYYGLGRQPNKRPH
jgi:transposase InsO family protein